MPGPGPYGNKKSWQDRANARFSRWTQNNPNASLAQRAAAKRRIGRIVRGHKRGPGRGPGGGSGLM
jgi:hypothetical protein